MKGGKVFKNDITDTEDLVEIQQLLARYAVGMTQGDIDGLVEVFTPDGTYSAFGETYALARFPELVGAAPKGLFMTGHAAGRPRRRHPDAATGHTAAVLHRALQRTTCASASTRDTYVRTDDGWRLKTRAMTFIRRSGDHDSGRPHDPTRPPPAAPDDRAVDRTARPDGRRRVPHGA